MKSWAKWFADRVAGKSLRKHWRDVLRTAIEADRDQRNGVDECHGQYAVGNGEPPPALDPELMRLAKKWAESF